MRLVKMCCLLLCGLMLTLVARPTLVSAATPDPVLAWIQIMNDTVIAGGTNPLVTSRVVALVSSSVFDAVNGIEGRYRPIHVTDEPPRHASVHAAAIEAAYNMLLKLYPAQSTTLTTDRDASIAALTGVHPASIAAGIAWGDEVANSIWDWRSTDGFTPPPPPFVGVLGLTGPTTVGVWRPTPLGNAPGAGPQFASMTPWTMKRASQFRPPPPPALTSYTYTTDYIETMTMGIFAGSPPRTADQSELALFWAGNTPLFWNRIALQIATAQSLSLSENAHLFAQMNLAMADAAIACWDAKYRYVFWRPITAIRDGDTDNNAATVANPTWTPWLDFFPAGTPAHPEYPSGHSTVSGAAAFVMETAFGDNTPFTVTSDVRPGTRSFASFSSATDEIADARVFGGIHFRNSCVQGNAVGRAVADFVLSHAMRSGHDHDDGNW